METNLNFHVDFVRNILTIEVPTSNFQKNCSQRCFLQPLDAKCKFCFICNITVNTIQATVLELGPCRNVGQVRLPAVSTKNLKWWPPKFEKIVVG